MNEMLTWLETAASRQDQFVGDASHELMSPLAAMRAPLDVAIAHPDPSRHAKLLSTLSDQVFRMTVLTDDLLVLARSTEASPKSTSDVVDLDELILVEARKVRAVEDRITVHVDIEAARIRGSERDLARALRNLVENAVEHAHSEIHLSLTTRDGWAQISVTDDGAGVPPADRDRLFERFIRLDPARTQTNAGGGFGLGLAIASQVAQAHGGALTVHDRADKRAGASFIMRLPVQDHHA
jgi:signal transduction histidine kinase